jgi:peroxin-5
MTQGMMNKAWDGAEVTETQREVEQQRIDHQKKLETFWQHMIDNYNPDDPQLTEKLDQEWRGMMENFDEGMFSEHWQKASDLIETQYLDMKKDYTFTKENNYADANQPHRIFLELIKKGNIGEAIKALEAHLSQNPTDHMGWVMLGGILQENDNDQKSVTALMQAVELKPDCLSALLMLGVGCTNIIDESHSVMYLQRWIKNNPLYSDFAGQELICPHKLGMGQYETTELMAINHIMMERFEEAKNHGGMNDSDFCMAYGVMAYIAREYKLAVDLMNKAVEIDPLNFSAWNKLGACLAQLNETEMSRLAYRKALDLKPNYVRPWVNLGMTYSSKVAECDPARLQDCTELPPERPHLEPRAEPRLGLRRVEPRLQPRVRQHPPSQTERPPHLRKPLPTHGHQ